jgi:hypothetical protein
MDPRNRHHAEKETKRLINLADMNQDGQLSWKEVKNQGRDFILSKFYDAGKELHRI